MRRTWPYWMMAMALPACGGESGNETGTPAEATAQAASAVTAVAPPKLYSYLVSGDVTETRYAVELAQPQGAARLARLEGCRLEADVRGLFGLLTSPIAPLDAADPRLTDPETPIIACPDRIASDARVYVEPNVNGASYLEYRMGAGGGVDAPSFVIPNRCVALMKHFRVPERARAAVAKPTEPPPAAAPRIRLSCANERPRNPYTGWQVHTAWAFNLDYRAFVLVQKGDASFLVDAIDGTTFNATTLSQDSQATAVVAKLRKLFAVPNEVESRETVLDGNAPELARPLLDVCVGRCGDPSWIPAHKHVSSGGLACASGTFDPATEECIGASAPSVIEASMLDGSTRRIGTLGATAFSLGACGAAETWERHLGFTVQPEVAPWIRAMEDRYDEGATQGMPALDLPCLVDVPTCRIAVRDGQDLSTTVLADLAPRACKKGESVLEITLAKRAQLTDRPFAIEASTLPASVKTVRVRGLRGEPTTVLVAQPRCGFNNTPCTEPKAAFAITGDLRVEIESLKLLPAAPPSGATAAAAPLARTAIEAISGPRRDLTVQIRDVQIGDRAMAPFWKGIRFSGGSLVVYDSNVRAFTDALQATEGKVAVVSWPMAQAYEVAALAQDGLTSGQLRDLRGRSIAGSAANFRALAFDANVQAVLVNMNVRGPNDVAWTNDRKDGTDEGLLAINTSFANGSDFFPRESLMLSVQGRGYLRFRAPIVSGMGNVIACPSRPFPTSPEIVPRIVLDVPSFERIAHDFNPGICTVESPWMWTPTDG
jgi:hypothetical protein